MVLIGAGYLAVNPAEAIGHTGFTCGDVDRLSDLALSRRLYTLRRSEYICFDSERTFERATELELRFDDTRYALIPNAYDRAAVPLLPMSRLSGVYHDVADTGGNRLPWLRRSAAELLRAASIVNTFLAKSNNTAKVMQPISDAGLGYSDLVLFAADLLRLRVPKPLAENPSLYEACADLIRWTTEGSGTVFLTALVPSSELTKHMVIRERHSEVVDVLPDRGWRRLWAPLWRSEIKQLSDRWRLPDSFGVKIDLHGAFDSMEYEVELVCPPGSYIEFAALTAADATNGGERRVLATSQHARPDTAHIAVTEELKAYADGAMSDLKLEIVARPTFHNGLRSPKNMASVATLSLWLLALFVGLAEFKVVGLDRAFHIRVRGFDRPSLTSFLLLAPTIIIVTLIRADEHPFTKKVVSDVRARTAMTGILLFLCALCFGIGQSGDALGVILFIAASLSTVFLGITRWSARRSERFSKPD